MTTLMFLKAIPFLAGAIFFIHRPTEPQANSSPCLPASTGSANMLEDYQFADTTTDAGMIAWRQSIGLPAVPVSQVILVSDTIICRRAVNAFNTNLGTPRHVPAVEVDVVRYGSTRYIIRDPVYTEGSWHFELVVDTAFAKIGVSGR